jgi:hypothetical protein
LMEELECPKKRSSFFFIENIFYNDLRRNN